MKKLLWSIGATALLGSAAFAQPAVPPLPAVSSTPPTVAQPARGTPAIAPLQTSAARPTPEILVIGYLEEELPQELAKVGVRVNTVTAEDIKNVGALDVTQSLQTTVPGLYIAPKRGPFDYVDISFQGSRTGDILWLVDGVRINNRLYSGTTPLDTIPASMIERIEVLESGQALFYGTQASAGAVNIVTKAFTDQPAGAFSIGGDSNTGRHIDGYVSDSLGPHEIVLFGSHDESKGHKPFPESEYQPSATDRHRGYEVTTLGGKYGLDLTEGLRFSASYLHTDAKLDDLQANGTNTRFNERDEDLLTAKIDYAPSDVLEVYLKGYYHWWNSYFTSFDNDIANPGTLIVNGDHDFWGFKDYGVNFLTKLSPGGPADFFVGYDYQNYSGRDDVLLISQQTERVHAVFGQIRTTPDLFSHARLAAGVRHNMPSHGEDATVWNVSGQIDVSDNLFLRANGGTSFRLPTAEELFADDCPFLACGGPGELGNPNLKPERSTNANASVGGILDLGAFPVHWEAIGFWREIEDMIEYGVTYNAVRDQDVFGNLPGKVKVSGGEFVLSVPFTDAFSADANYTYNHVRQSGSSLDLPNIPVDAVKVSLDYHPMTLPVGANVIVNYVGDVFDDRGLTRENIGDYVVVDFGARVFLGQDRRHRIDLHLINAFDEEYSAQLRTRTDDLGNDYTVHNIGVPRTFVMTYTYAFH